MPEFLFKTKLGAEPCNFIKKEALAQVFSSEFFEIFKNTCFTEHLQTTASAGNGLKSKKSLKQKKFYLMFKPYPGKLNS